MTIFGGNDPLTVSPAAPINTTVVPARVLRVRDAAAYAGQPSVSSLSGVFHADSHPGELAQHVG
jgi:hypothetical protein